MNRNKMISHNRNSEDTQKYLAVFYASQPRRHAGNALFPKPIHPRHRGERVDPHRADPDAGKRLGAACGKVLIIGFAKRFGTVFTLQGEQRRRRDNAAYRIRDCIQPFCRF